MIRDILNKGRSDQFQNLARGVMIKGRFVHQGRSDQGTLYHGIKYNSCKRHWISVRPAVYGQTSIGCPLFRQKCSIN
jgi:hypothetical protein